MRPGRGVGGRRHAERGRRRAVRPHLEGVEARVLLANFVVTTTSDVPVAPTPQVPDPLTLRQAIDAANANPGPDTISFRFPARNIPGIVNYDPTFQTWRIRVASALPAITDTLTIDGYSQRVITGVSAANEIQSVTLGGTASGGTFTLTFEGQTTAPIPYNATADQVGAALASLSNIGSGNVVAAGGPVDTQPVTLTFQNALTTTDVGQITGDASGLTSAAGKTAAVTTATATQGNSGDITSDPSTLAVGFNAAVRVILDGSVAGASPGSLVPSSFPGLTVQTDHNIIRGLSLDGFGTGIDVQGAGAIGNLIQGNYVGRYLLYSNPILKIQKSTVGGLGNGGAGIVIDAPTNNTVGGVAPETHNGIAGNGLQGVHIAPGATGNLVVGNLIGVLEQDAGLYYQVGNGAEGVLVESSSNVLGGAVAGATNVISANETYGIHVVGPAAVRNRIEANYIGTDVNGTFKFGQGFPGNGRDSTLSAGNMRDGIFIDNAPDNRIGIPGGTGGVGNPAGNVISGNFGAGVRIAGAAATGNLVQGNAIGTGLDGGAALPNAQEGVVLLAAANVVGGAVDGAGNLISGNRRGVLISGAAASGNLVAGNLIGTDGKGAYDLGNALEGVRIDSAAANTVGGLTAQARNVISGNNVGVLIVGAAATANTVAGNYIGTDLKGALDLGNKQEGVRIDSAAGNAIGGAAPAAANVISANHWGVALSGPGARGNLVQGNLIGTGADGTSNLGNEVDGVLVTGGAAFNLIGGLTPGLANTIAFNVRDGVRVETAGGVSNPIVSNAIFANGFGIDLIGPADLPSGVTPNTPGGPHTGPNDLQNYPVLTLATSNIATSTTIAGTLNSTPGATFLIQFFANAVRDPSGFGQGQTLLGQTFAATDASGNAAFDVTLPGAVPAGQFVTATATDPAGNTSEFSAAATVVHLPGAFQFRMSSYAANEGDGTAAITVVRAGGSSGTASVDYATSDATPGARADYVPASGRLVFDDGETSKTFTIAILADDVFRPDQAVNLTLSNPTGGASLGTPSTALLTIHDKDTPRFGGFAFDAASYEVAGGSGTAVITVDRADGADAPATVHYATGGGTAVAGVDYASVSGTLDFPAGATTASFAVPILAPRDIVGNRTVGLPLSGPTGGATLGTPSAATLTVLDTVGPTVRSVRFVNDRRGGIVELVVGFSEPLRAATATDLVNYGYSLRTAGRDHRFGTRDDLLIPIVAATYDPADFTVRLTLGRGIHPPTPFRLAINEQTDVPGAGRGVSDAAGNLLDGDRDGRPGGPFVAILSGRTGPYGAATPAAVRARGHHRPAPRGPLAHARLSASGTPGSARRRSPAG